MAPEIKPKGTNLSSHPPPFSSSSFIPAVSNVAVAQICLSAGYTSAEPAALRSLSAVAALYLQTLARSAASIANSKGRTQTNILDLIRAIEDLGLPQGFAGASDPASPLLRSAVVRDLRSFVRRVREIPFLKPIGRREAGLGPGSSPAASFAQAGREPPGPHVPMWLPCFPERREEERRRERGEERRRWEEKGGIFKAEMESEEDDGGKAVAGRNNGVGNKKILQREEGVWVPCFGWGWEKKRELASVVERERVRFELGRENINSIVDGRRKKKRLLLMFDGEGEE